MNHFLIVFTKKLSARNKFIDSLKNGVEHLLPYLPKKIYYNSLSENIFFICTQAHDYLKLRPRHIQSGDEFIVYDGFCYDFLGEKSVSEIFLNTCKKYGLNCLNDHLHGEYCLGYYNKNLDIICGLSDFTGLRPLYYFEDNQYFAISNRQMLLNPLLTESEKISLDMYAIIDLISKGNKFTDQSILKGVRLLRPGHYICFSKEKGSKVHRNTPIFIQRGIPTKSDYIRSVAEIVANFDALNYFPGLKDKAIRISLTGGEDSRFVLAAALNSTIKDRIETFSYGFPDNPDITAAELVARKAGVPHVKNIHPFSQKNIERSIEELWNDLAKHAFRFEGAPGAWDGGSNSAKQVSLDLVGYFDAYFKRVRPSNAIVDITSIDIARKLMREIQQPFDPLNLIKPDAIRKDEIFCDEWLENTLYEGAELNDIPELFYFDFRLPWWGGSMASNVGSLYRIAPLASQFASRTGLKQSLEDRRDRRFIFEAMLLLKPDLLELPYLNKKWPDRFQNYANYIKLPKEELNLPASKYSTIPWQIQLVKKGGYFIKDYIDSHNIIDIYEVINKEKLNFALSKPAFLNNTPSIRSILNLCEILILMTGEQQRYPDDILNSNLSGIEFHTNIPQLENLKKR